MPPNIEFQFLFPFFPHQRTVGGTDEYRSDITVRRDEHPCKLWLCDYSIVLVKRLKTVGESYVICTIN